MKKCSSCDIKVGGSWAVCPICQNTLEGVDTPNLWPNSAQLRQKTIFLKIQLFAVMVGIVVSLIVDFLMGVHGEVRWSVIVFVLGSLFEILVYHLSTRKFMLASIIAKILFCGCVMVLFIAWYLKFLSFCIIWIIPIMISISLVLNFAFAMFDKSGNAMVYLLGNLLVLVVPYVIMLFLNGGKKIPLMWNISLIIGCVTFLAIAVFEGSKMLLEARKRITF